MPSVEEGAREMRREYVFVPVTWAFTSAPCASEQVHDRHVRGASRRW